MFHCNSARRDCATLYCSRRNIKPVHEGLIPVLIKCSRGKSTKPILLSDPTKCIRYDYTYTLGSHPGCDISIPANRIHARFRFEQDSWDIWLIMDEGDASIAGYSIPCHRFQRIQEFYEVQFESQNNYIFKWIPRAQAMEIYLDSREKLAHSRTLQSIHAQLKQLLADLSVHSSKRKGESTSTENEEENLAIGSSEFVCLQEDKTCTIEVMGQQGSQPLEELSVTHSEHIERQSKTEIQLQIGSMTISLPNGLCSQKFPQECITSGVVIATAPILISNLMDNIVPCFHPLGNTIADAESIQAAKSDGSTFSSTVAATMNLTKGEPIDYRNLEEIVADLTVNPTLIKDGASVTNQDHHQTFAGSNAKTISSKDQSSVEHLTLDAMKDLLKSVIVHDQTILQHKENFTSWYDHFIVISPPSNRSTLHDYLLCAYGSANKTSLRSSKSGWQTLIDEMPLMILRDGIHKFYHLNGD